jgi:CAP-Gly domain-containing linker protein 1
MAQSKISAGSRASKYIGVTAKQLSTRDLGSVVKPPQTSPQKSLRLGSPPRPSGLGVTQTTPKAPRASLSLKPRPSIPSLTTPRPTRLQLGVAKNDMPPPPVPDKKPVTPTLSQASNDSSYMDEALPDMPNLTVSNGISPSPSRSGRSSIYATPSPEPSFHVMEMQRLQTLVQTLEAQNKELKQAELQEATVPAHDAAKIRLEEQHAATVQRASELEASLRTIERNGIEKQGKIEVLERLVMEAKEDVAKARAEGEARTKEVKLKLEESETLVGSLKGLIEAKASAASENDANLAANQAEIEVLRGQVVRITNDLEQERKELGSHIDELRRAGQVRFLSLVASHLSAELLEQETIALYEERISAFEAERYDSEALVQALEEKLRVASYQPSPEELSKQASTAAQIDNETLKEQVTHLQQRISHLEDQLEDAQALVEREEEATKVRIARYKEKDTQRQQELEELRHLATSATKSDSAARTRVEELEEALRENTAALEDARAEIESLRTDLTVSLVIFVNKVLSSPFGQTESRKLDGIVGRGTGCGSSQPDVCYRSQTSQGFVRCFEDGDTSDRRSTCGGEISIGRSKPPHC